ncbi:MAG: hypothetical protein O7G88_12145 [bacterium]|nr:hypothetical protein [bacterium]
MLSRTAFYAHRLAGSISPSGAGDASQTILRYHIGAYRSGRNEYDTDCVWIVLQMA